MVRTCQNIGSYSGRCRFTSISLQFLFVIIMLNLTLRFPRGVTAFSLGSQLNSRMTRVAHRRPLPMEGTRTILSISILQNQPLRILNHNSLQSVAIPLPFPTISSRCRLFSSTSDNTNDISDDDDSVFADEATTFASLGVQSSVLLDRLEKLGLTRPTKVQVETMAKLYKQEEHGDNDEQQSSTFANNVIIGSETGSGKTLAYLLPLLDSILQEKQQSKLSYDFARAVILVPNKELVQQVLRMALPLCGGKKALVWGANNLVLPPELDAGDGQPSDPSQIVRLAVMPGGLAEPMDFKPFRDTLALGGQDPPVDLIVSTPAALGPLALKPKHIDMFADIQTLVIDEADMLLDGGYIRPLENVLMGFRRADRLDASFGVPKTQHIFCAATLPDMGLKSVDAYLQRKFPYANRIQMSGMHNARHYGLQEETQWIGPMDTKKERMETLLELFKTPVSEGGLQGEKVMIFLNSVQDVEGAQGALEREGISSLPYHAKIGLADRSSNLDRFRRYQADSRSEAQKGDEVPVLVCTDLASRGLDVPGVTAVVQLQFAGNVVAHLHRMGRCGRAGQRTGRGIVFYQSDEAALVEVVQDAEDQQVRMALEGDVVEEGNWDDDENGEAGNSREVSDAGKVKQAFSRKRGFTKKLKKQRRASDGH